MILYLKVMVVVILSFLGKIPLTTTTQLGIRVGLSNGLPSILPSRWRSLVRSRSIPHLRWILSLLSLYRSMKSKYGPPDFSKISAPPFEGEVPADYIAFCMKFFKRFARMFTPKTLVPDFYDSSAAWSTSSGPTSRPAWEGRGLDMIGLKANGLWDLIPKWLDLVCGYRDHEDIGVSCFDFNRSAAVATEELPYEDQAKLWSSPPAPDKTYPVGKLSLKEEPAGKLRIFAICDWWTQVLFSPLHTAMEKVLKSLPQDATFDQEGRTKEFASRGYEQFWSFDLKSATDLIPNVLYVPMMTALLGSKEAAVIWLKFLTERDFIWRYKERIPGSRKYRELISRHRYTRGQPMGARSSWPALALVHHALVLYAAMQVGQDPWTFVKYLVLGDDVVVADEQVANQYLKNCELLGIPVGLAKSFPGAKGMFQFANQDWLAGTNISPVSLKADLSALKPLGAIEFARQIIVRWPSAKNSIIARFLRILLDDGQYASVVHDMKRWRFGATASSIVRTLLTPGNPATRLLGIDAGASDYLWLSSISRGVSISEVNELTKEEVGRNRFVAIAQSQPSAVDVQIALEQARGWISELIGQIWNLREEIKPHLGPSSLGGVAYQNSALITKAEGLVYELARLSDEVWLVLIPYLDTVRSCNTYGQLVSSMEFVRTWCDTCPHVMTFVETKGEKPSPWKTTVLPRAMSPGVLAVLREHGYIVRSVPSSFLRRMRLEDKKLSERRRVDTRTKTSTKF
jgi:hypothetical protein